MKNNVINIEDYRIASVEDYKINSVEEYKINFTTIFVGDFKSAFIEEVTKLIALMLPIEDRKQAVEFLIDRYIIDTGKRPDDIRMRVGKKTESALDVLASHLLYEALEGDTRPDKMSIEDIPVMTENQHKKRVMKRGEITVDVNAACRTIGSDNKNYRKPTRRTLKPYEIDMVNKRKDERLKETDPKYRELTRPSTITRDQVVA